MKTYTVHDCIKAGYTLEPLGCLHCGSLEVTYHQDLDDAYCSNCGEWQIDEDLDDAPDAPDAIEIALFKCMKHICSQSITRQSSAYLGIEKTDLDTCDGALIYVNGCPERDLCDRIVDLIKRNRRYYQ